MSAIKTSKMSATEALPYIGDRLSSRCRESQSRRAMHSAQIRFLAVHYRLGILRRSWRPRRACTLETRGKPGWGGNVNALVTETEELKSGCLTEVAC